MLLAWLHSNKTLLWAPKFEFNLISRVMKHSSSFECFNFNRLKIKINLSSRQSRNRWRARCGPTGHHFVTPCSILHPIHFLASNPHLHLKCVCISWFRLYLALLTSEFFPNRDQINLFQLSVSLVSSVPKIMPGTQ